MEFIARLVRAEPLVRDRLVPQNASRVSFEFDAIEARIGAKVAHDTIEGRDDRSRLALLRILTTEENFRRLSGADDVRDGQWYHVILAPRTASGALAWVSPLGDSGYADNIPQTVEELRFLFSEDEGPLTGVGAAVANERALAQDIAEACKFPASAADMNDAASQLLAKIPKPDKIIVRDVGQASFSSAVDERGKELFHLDAGWPVSFNNKTVRHQQLVSVRDVPVILSHWDWDHLHGYHVIPGLAGSTWVAPVQKLGPGAALVANTLAAAGRLLGVIDPHINTRAVQLRRCSGPASNLNQSGLGTKVTLQSGATVLFVGDADYDIAPPGMAFAPDFIVATHHGAEFGGVVPTANNGKGLCVVSVGKGNCYRHPSDAAIALHAAAGWDVTYTCNWDTMPRGDRTLGP